MNLAMFGHQALAVYSSLSKFKFCIQYVSDEKFSTKGNMIGRETFTTIATSNVFLGPDGYVYVTGNHGVYRKKRLSAPIWSNEGHSGLIV